MRPETAGHLAMLAFSALVAGSFSLGALAANDISPAALNAVRFWVAAGLLGIAAFGTGAMSPKVAAAPWRYVLLAAIFASYFVMMFEGLKTAPAVSAAAIFTLTPIMSAGFGWLLLRQITTPRMAVALAIGATGAIWVIFRADFAALRNFEVGRGEAIYAVGCFAHALFTPLTRKLNRGEPALAFVFCVLLAGAVLLTAYGWRDLWTTDWANLPQIVWATIFYTAVLASAATFTLLQFATMRLPSAKVMAYTYLTPSWVILWQLALGAAVPSGLVLIGVALTIAALLLLLRD